MAGTGDKLLTAAEIKEVTDTKVDKDFSALTALPNGLSDTDLINVRRSGTNYKLSGSDLAPTPLVASITTGQWSGSGSDYYITVTASNVTANSILVPTYDHTSDSRLKGPVWCVPAAGSFTIHTSAIPTGTVTVMVQFIGRFIMAGFSGSTGVPQKQMTDAIAQSTAGIPLIETGSVTVTTGETKGALGYGGAADINFAKVHKSIPKVFTNIYDSASYWTSTCMSVTTNGARISIAGNQQNVSKTVFWIAISF